MQWTLQAAGRVDAELEDEEVEIKNPKNPLQPHEVVTVTRITHRYTIEEQKEREDVVIEKLTEFARQQGWTFARLCTTHHGIIDLV